MVLALVEVVVSHADVLIPGLVKLRDQVEPDRHFVSPIVAFHTRLYTYDTHTTVSNITISYMFSGYVRITIYAIKIISYSVYLFYLSQKAYVLFILFEFIPYLYIIRLRYAKQLFTVLSQRKHCEKTKIRTKWNKNNQNKYLIYLHRKCRIKNASLHNK